MPCCLAGNKATSREGEVEVDKVLLGALFVSGTNMILAVAGSKLNPHFKGGGGGETSGTGRYAYYSGSFSEFMDSRNVFVGVEVVSMKRVWRVVEDLQWNGLLTRVAFQLPEANAPSVAT